VIHRVRSRMECGLRRHPRPGAVNLKSPPAPNAGSCGFDLTILDGTMKLARGTNPGVSRKTCDVGEEASEP
jgi:hypothetical protein